MTPQHALSELLARVGCAGAEPIFITSAELDHWPAQAVGEFRANRLLTGAAPASSTVCPGCERDCIRPVHVFAEAGKEVCAFVVCDKRDDTNRVPVPVNQLEQWQSTGRHLADALASMLQVTNVAKVPALPNEWNVGLLRGKTFKAQLTLIADDALYLSFVGHRVPLTNVLELSATGLVIDSRQLLRMVDHPKEGGDTVAETPEQRRERLAAEVRGEKLQGNKAFLKTVAAREGIDISRLKQLLVAQRGKKIDSTWAGLIATTATKGSSKSNKR